MKSILIYLLVAVLTVTAMTQCGSVRTQGNRIQTARARRLAEAEGE